MGLGAVYGTQYLRYRNSPEYKAVKDWENLQKQYAEDTFGGDTPEETLRLFVEALKKGDTDLAAKYFVLDKQQEWREELSRIEDKNLLKFMIEDLEKAKKSKSNDKEAFFTVTNENKVVSVLIDIRENVNGKWKILDL